MRKPFAAAALTAALLVLATMCWADGPVASAEGKLFGFALVCGGPDGDDQGPAEEVLFPLYEKSGATVVFLGVDWGNCERNPGSGASTYDFSSFDNQLFRKSAKAKISWIGLGNEWADKIKVRDPERYWKLAESFVTAFVKHANTLGIHYFQVPGNEYNLLGRPDWAVLYVEPLKHISRAVKAAGSENKVIAGNLSYGGDDVVQALYDAGAKGYFDVLDIHAYSNDPRTGVDVFQIVEAHRAMARNGDGDKQIFLGEGWGPGRMVPGVKVRKGPEEPPSDAEIEAMRGFVENGYRNLLTERDIYDPRWVLGGRFFTMNDNWGGRHWKDRAKYVDENGDGKPDYIMLDGYKNPPDANMEPTFYNGGLVDFNGKPKDGLMDEFLPKIAENTFEASITADGTVLNYVAEKPYKLALKITNQTKDDMSLDRFSVRCHGFEGAAITAVPGGDAPRSVAAGKDATASFTITFPGAAANKQVTLIGDLEYSIGGKKHVTDCWTTITVTPGMELTLLPPRAILDGKEDFKRVGMSVINHGDTPFEGKITLTTSPGIEVTPAEFTTKIDGSGLEAYVFSISADKNAAPGHYAVFLDVGGKAKDWVAVDVPVRAKKAKIEVDGKLDDWKGAQPISIAEIIKNDAGRATYNTIGKGMFAYDESSFYAAFEIDDAKHVQDRQFYELWQDDSVQMAFDPLMDGARTQSGGYKGDDYEFTFAGTRRGPVVTMSQGPGGRAGGSVSDVVPFAFRQEGAKSIYEIAFPWKQVAPLAPKTGGMFAMSVLVNRNDGAGRSYVEWGGGIAEGKDPRKFIPVLLTE